MLIYHGSNVEVSKPRLIPQNRFLDFVSANRAGNAPQKGYDLIFGPVADDDVYRTFALYSSGILTKQQTVEALKVKKLFNQLVFATEKALSFLTFAGAATVEE